MAFALSTLSCRCATPSGGEHLERSLEQRASDPAATPRPDHAEIADPADVSEHVAGHDPDGRAVERPIDASAGSQESDCRSRRAGTPRDSSASIPNCPANESMDQLPAEPVVVAGHVGPDRDARSAASKRRNDASTRPVHVPEHAREREARRLRHGGGALLGRREDASSGRRADRDRAGFSLDAARAAPAGRRRDAAGARGRNESIVEEGLVDPRLGEGAGTRRPGPRRSRRRGVPNRSSPPDPDSDTSSANPTSCRSHARRIATAASRSWSTVAGRSR